MVTSPSPPCEDSCGPCRMMNGRFNEQVEQLPAVHSSKCSFTTLKLRWVSFTLTCSTTLKHMVPGSRAFILTSDESRYYVRAVFPCSKRAVLNIRAAVLMGRDYAAHVWKHKTQIWLLTGESPLRCEFTPTSPHRGALIWGAVLRFSAACRFLFTC